jgi:hypothetical protein
MTAWRMSFRVGNQGYEMWPECLRLGVAAITYHPLAKIDLSKHPKREPSNLWDQLEPTQKASLSRVAYEMKAGDAIYVKKGPKIVDKGLVKGPANKNAYTFDSDFGLRQPNGTPWAHQVPVEWSSDFPEIRILLGGEQVAVKKLSPDDVGRLEAAIDAASEKTRNSPSEGTARSELLLEEAYYRESPARLKIIIPRHNKLSNAFTKWLKKEHTTDAIQEHNRIDIHFKMMKQMVLAELKICFGVGTTRSIREALGQLLEYNHYPKRQAADVWLIILDEEPSNDDRQFIDRLREKKSLPLTIGWASHRGFSFHPSWP